MSLLLQLGYYNLNSKRLNLVDDTSSDIFKEGLYTSFKLISRLNTFLVDKAYI